MNTKSAQAATFWRMASLAVGVVGCMGSFPAQAFDYFSGAYGGVNAGFQQTQAVYDLSAGQLATLTPLSGISPAYYQNAVGSWARNGASVGLNAGYGLAAGVIYVGVEGGYYHVMSSDSAGITLQTQTTEFQQAGGQINLVPSQITSSLSLKPGNRIQAGLRVGYLTTEKSMVFLALSVAYAQYQLTAQNALKIAGSDGAGTGTDPQNYQMQGGVVQTAANCGAGSNCPSLLLSPVTTKGKAISMMLGVGAQMFLGRSWSLHVRYDYDLGKKINKLLDIQPKATMIRVGLTYNF